MNLIYHIPLKVKYCVNSLNTNVWSVMVITKNYTKVQPTFKSRIKVLMTWWKSTASSRRLRRRAAKSNRWFQLANVSWSRSCILSAPKCCCCTSWSPTATTLISCGSWLPISFSRACDKLKSYFKCCIWTPSRKTYHGAQQTDNIVITCSQR